MLCARTPSARPNEMHKCQYAYGLCTQCTCTATGHTKIAITMYAALQCENCAVHFLLLSNWWLPSVKGDAYVCKHWSASSLQKMHAQLMAWTLLYVLNLLAFLLHFCCGYFSTHASQISSRQMCVCVCALLCFLFNSTTELFETPIFRHRVSITISSFSNINYPLWINRRTGIYWSLSIKLRLKMLFFCWFLFRCCTNCMRIAISSKIRLMITASAHELQFEKKNK